MLPVDVPHELLAFLADSYAVYCRVPSSCTVVYCRVLSCTVVGCCAVSCGVVYCAVVHCRALSCTVVYCRVLSCRVVSCRAPSPWSPVHVSPAPCHRCRRLVSLWHAQAPRTAVGITAKGELLSLVVDGEEDIRAGANLYTMQDIMLASGALHAVNLDGGGSSDAVYEGRIVSHPTCEDTKVECERAVSTVTCISEQTSELEQ